MSAGVALLVFILAFVIFSMLLKVPVPFGLAIASLFVFLGTNMNPITVAQYSFASLDSFALLAIPFYIFAGVLMEYSGISKLVVNWIQSIIGRIRGSLGIICTVTCMAFGVLTGSAMATISAIGKVMAPEWIRMVIQRVILQHCWQRHAFSEFSYLPAFLALCMPLHRTARFPTCGWLQWVPHWFSWLVTSL